MLKTTKALIPILLVMLSLGAIGAWDRLAYGKQNLNFGSYIPWGLWVGLYIYLVGLSGGAFFIVFLHHAVGIRSLRRVSLYALPLAFATIAAGLLLVLADLGHMERFWTLYTRPNPTSILAWMVWVYSAYVLVLIAMLYAIAARRERLLRPLSFIGFLLVVTFGGGEGALFGVLGAKPFWNSGLLPIRFLFSAFLSGVALVAFTAIFLRHWPSDGEHGESVGFLRSLILALLATNLLVEFSDFSVTHYAAAPAVLEAHDLMVFGPYWWVFWIMQILVGLILPAILLVPRWGLRPSNLALSGLLIAIGYAGTKQNVVLPGLAVPEFRALPEAYVHARLSLLYFPSVTEWLLAIGAAAGAALVFLIVMETLWRLREGKAQPLTATPADWEPLKEGRVT